MLEDPGRSQTEKCIYHFIAVVQIAWIKIQRCIYKFITTIKWEKCNKHLVYSFKLTILGRCLYHLMWCHDSEIICVPETGTDLKNTRMQNNNIFLQNWLMLLENEVYRQVVHNIMYLWTRGANWHLSVNRIIICLLLH